MSYKLLVSDLDYTLISTERGLTPKNQEAIKKAIGNGLKFCLCSGRSYMSLESFEKKLGINIEGFYGIAFNGNMVYDAYNHNVLYEKMLNNDTAQLILSNTKHYDVSRLLYVRDKLYAGEEIKEEVVQDYAKGFNLEVIKIPNLNNIKTDVSKIILKGNRNILEIIFLDMQKIIEGKCNMFFTAHDLLEFTNLDATKGKALLFLANYLNINMSEVIAVGDNHNDISMIKEAGLGISVKNGVEELKKIADYITLSDNENDAIAEVLEKFIDVK